jgi:lipopolysaccharide transport system permease protein
VVLFLVMLATNAPFTIYIILTIIPILVLVILTIGAGLILASLNVFFRDIEHLYGVFLTLLMYATPIFYPASIVPESWRWIQTINPLYGIIECCRSVFLYGTIYDPLTLLPSTIIAVSLLIIGLVVFYKLQDKFILHI